MVINIQHGLLSQIYQSERSTYVRLKFVYRTKFWGEHEEKRCNSQQISQEENQRS